VYYFGGIAIAWDILLLQGMEKTGAFQSYVYTCFAYLLPKGSSHFTIAVGHSKALPQLHHCLSMAIHTRAPCCFRICSFMIADKI
jgi:hypothetical protein